MASHFRINTRGEVNLSKILKCLRGLFYGGRDTFSMGRVAFCVTFGLAIYRFYHGLDITENHLFMLGLFLGYIGYGKKLNFESNKKKKEITIDDNKSESHK
jgi:hypothetical protein